MIGIIGLALIYIVFTAFSVRDIYTTWGSNRLPHPITLLWFSFTIGVLVWFLCRDVLHYLNK